MRRGVKVKKLHPNAVMPVKSTDGAACYDVCAVEDVTLQRSVTGVRTGLAFEVPTGYMLEIRPRSGLSRKGVRLANSPGTLDSDYRGELLVLLCTTGTHKIYDVKAGDRVAQVRLVELDDVTFMWSEELSKTVRGDGGFGSTGR